MKKTSYWIYLILTRLSLIIGFLSWSLSKKRKKVKANLTVLGNASILNQIKTFAWYNLYWTEFFFLSSRLSTKEILAKSTLHNNTDFELANKKGCILVLPHIGGWEMAGVLLNHNSRNVAAIAESLDNKKLQNWCTTTREKKGIKIFFNDDPKLISKCLEHIESGGILCIVGDRALDAKHVTKHYVQDYKSNGKDQTFVNLATGAALLSIKAKTDTYVVVTPYVRSGSTNKLSFVHEFIIDKKIEVPVDGNLKERIDQITTQIFESFMKYFKLFPSQWHCLENYFKEESARCK